MSQPAILVPIGSNCYAIPISWTREVLATPPITALPTARPHILGLINLRGQIVVLLDTSLLLGTGRASAPPYAVVVSTGHGPVALGATALPERVLLDDPIGPSALPGTSGTFKIGSRVAVLLDLPDLLADDHVGGSDRDHAPARAV